MKISELKERKKELGYSNLHISELSGVPLSTVQKIFGGSTETPRYETLKKIEDALYPKGYYEYKGPFEDYELRRMHVHEALEEYQYSYIYGYDLDLEFNGKKQGEFTVDDLLDSPEGVRLELIDGYLYDLASPTTIHQAIASRVYLQIATAMDELGGSCTVFGVPVDTQLSADDKKNAFEPDLQIVCDKSKLANDKHIVIGAPDFVMEVLSPSTMGRDRVQKYHKYRIFGVREYWIVDPFMREVLVNLFDGENTTVKHYSFEDTVPVSIFGGKIKVDFAKISNYLRDHLDFDSGSVK